MKVVEQLGNVRERFEVGGELHEEDAADLDLCARTSGRRILLRCLPKEIVCLVNCTRHIALATVTSLHHDPLFGEEFGRHQLR